jgi:PH (Pleckstrin Homology) domain-containing protein
VRIRNPRPPDEPDDSDDAYDDSEDAFDDDFFEDEFEESRPARPVGPPPDSVSYRVPIMVIAAKFGVAALLVLVTLVFGVREQVTIGLAAALAVIIFAARDVLARERLRADADGLVAVSGYVGRHHLDWSDVRRMIVDSRLRLGARTETLEVDAGDQIYLFGRFDLGVPPEDALATLEQIRPTG